MSTIQLTFEKSRTYNLDAATMIPGAVNSNVRLASYPAPICFERAQGAYLYDLDGNRHLDYALGMGPTILGHAPKVVCEAVSRSLDRGQLFGGQHPPELALARHLKQLVPSAEKVRLGMTGSEVVQAAIRLARAHTGRQKYIKFEGQYHGWYDNVLVNHSPVVNDDTPSPRPIHFESLGQAHSVAEDVVVLPWNDADVVEAALRTESIAAVITEPAMCNTGAIPPAPGFLESLRELCTRHGTVLIFDEVITGFRLALGGAQSRFSVTPDLSTFAKAMAGGFPISALVGRADLMDRFGNGSVNHSGTYNSNAQSVVAAVATIEDLKGQGEDRLTTLNRSGDEFLGSVAELAARHKAPLRAQGFGSCFNLFFADREHVVKDYHSYKRTDLKMQQEFLKRLTERGVRPTNRGTWFVSTAHAKSDFDETLEVISDVLSELAF